jgi:hypothetical protein
LVQRDEETIKQLDHEKRTSIIGNVIDDKVLEVSHLKRTKNLIVALP